MVDLSAWVLLLVCAVPLWIMDHSMLMTLIQWTAFAGALVGINIILTRIIFPQIDLSEFVTAAKEGSLPASIVVLAVAFVIGLTFLGVVVWAKA